MGFHSGFIGILMICIFMTASCAPDSTLRLVNLVYRHGDRSPTKTYPTNPNNENQTTNWPQGFGWLTPDGMREQYSLGSYLRRRYDGFLNSTYINTEIRVESSDVERCLMSAYANLAGLYPPIGDQEWNKLIPWQPIPVHTRPVTEDNYLNEGEPCPRYQQLFNASLKSEMVKKEETQNKRFYDFIVNKTGVVKESIKNIWEIADVLYCEKQHKISSPSWVNKTVFEKLRNLEAWGFNLMFQGKEEQRLKGGPLLKRWLNLTQEKINNKTLMTKMNMFSAHDTTVVSLLSVLGLYNLLSPPYTATVIMELHQNSSGTYYVQLFYRNVTSQNATDDTPPHELTLPGCDPKCPFDKFVSLTKDMVPVNWKTECAIGGGGGKPDRFKFNTATIIAVSVASGVILILVVVVVVMCCKRCHPSGLRGFQYKMTI